MFKNIVVPLDGSETSEKAIQAAAQFEHAADTKLHLVHVYDESAAYAPIGMYDAYAYEVSAQVDDQAIKSGRDYLKKVAEESAVDGLEISAHFEIGEPADEILKLAEKVDADLIVMTTHGRSGFERWAMGSVTERVLHHAQCPVLTFRDKVEIERVMITLDGSPLAAEAVAPGVEVARLSKAPVLLFRVENRPPVLDRRTADQMSIMDQAEPGLAEQFTVDSFNESDEYLDELAQTLDYDDVKCHARHERGAVNKVILQEAETAAGTLIVMSTHGRSGIRRWVYGSVAEKVLRAYDGAMLIVRSQE